MNYHHLSQAERYQIYSLKRAGFNLTRIAQELSRSVSTISREIKHGSGARGYRPDQADRVAKKRAQRVRATQRTLSARCGRLWSRA